MTREKEIEAKVENILPSEYIDGEPAGGIVQCCRKLLKQSILSGRLWLPVSEEIIFKKLVYEIEKAERTDLGYIASALHKLLRGE